MIAKFWAAVLVVLAFLPFTAPFGPCLNTTTTLLATGEIVAAQPNDQSDAGSLVAPVTSESGWLKMLLLSAASSGAIGPAGVTDVFRSDSCPPVSLVRYDPHELFSSSVLRI